MNQSMVNKEGFVCCVKGCDKTKRLFSKFGLQMHIRNVHGGGLKMSADAIAKKWGKWKMR